MFCKNVGLAHQSRDYKRQIHAPNKICNDCITVKQIKLAPKNDTSKTIKNHETETGTITEYHLSKEEEHYSCSSILKLYNPNCRFYKQLLYNKTNRYNQINDYKGTKLSNLDAQKSTTDGRNWYDQKQIREQTLNAGQNIQQNNQVLSGNIKSDSNEYAVDQEETNFFDDSSQNQSKKAEQSVSSAKSPNRPSSKNRRSRNGSIVDGGRRASKTHKDGFNDPKENDIATKSGNNRKKQRSNSTQTYSSRSKMENQGYKFKKDKSTSTSSKRQQKPGGLGDSNIFNKEVISKTGSIRSNNLSSKVKSGSKSTLSEGMKNKKNNLSKTAAQNRYNNKSRPETIYENEPLETNLSEKYQKAEMLRKNLEIDRAQFKKATGSSRPKTIAADNARKKPTDFRSPYYDDQKTKNDVIAYANINKQKQDQTGASLKRNLSDSQKTRTPSYKSNRSNEQTINASKYGKNDGKINMSQMPGWDRTNRKIPEDSQGGYSKMMDKTIQRDFNTNQLKSKAFEKENERQNYPKSDQFKSGLPTKDYVKQNDFKSNQLTSGGSTKDNGKPNGSKTYPYNSEAFGNDVQRQNDFKSNQFKSGASTKDSRRSSYSKTPQYNSEAFENDLQKQKDFKNNQIKSGGSTKDSRRSSDSKTYQYNSGAFDDNNKGKRKDSITNQFKSASSRKEENKTDSKAYQSPQDFGKSNQFQRDFKTDDLKSGASKYQQKQTDSKDKQLTTKELNAVSKSNGKQLDTNEMRKRKDSITSKNASENDQEYGCSTKGVKEKKFKKLGRKQKPIITKDIMQIKEPPARSNASPGSSANSIDFVTFSMFQVQTHRKKIRKKI